MNYNSKVFELVKKGNFKITFAESMTGGLICAKFIENPGASSFIDKSYVVYSTISKEEELNVTSALIDRYGIVSSEVSEAMLEGLKEKVKADIYVTITGNAGPTLQPNTTEMVAYVSFKFREKIQTYRIEQKYNNKQKNIEKTVDQVYKYLYLFIQDQPII